MTGVALKYNRLGGVGEFFADSLAGLSDFIQIARCDNDAVLVNDAYRSADDILHLMNDGLKQAVGHKLSPFKVLKHFIYIFYILTYFLANFNSF